MEWSLQAPLAFSLPPVSASCCSRRFWGSVPRSRADRATIAPLAPTARLMSASARGATTSVGSREA